jgi:hypothetical protein
MIGRDRNGEDKWSADILVRQWAQPAPASDSPPTAFALLLFLIMPVGSHQVVGSVESLHQQIIPSLSTFQGEPSGA